MANKIINIVYIVLYAVALAAAVIFGIKAFESDNMLNLAIDILAAGFAIYGITRHAKRLQHSDEEENDI